MLTRRAQRCVGCWSPILQKSLSGHSQKEFQGKYSVHYQSFCTDLCDMNVQVAALLCITHISDVVVTVPQHCLIPFATRRLFVCLHTTRMSGKEKALVAVAQYSRSNADVNYLDGFPWYRIWPGGQ